MTRAGTGSLIALGLSAVLGFTACSFSPLAHRISVGHDPFVVIVGEGIDHHTDLFAIPADGGDAAQFTFTPLSESDPQLTPNGDVVAFLRSNDAMPATPRRVVLMNLLSGGELPISMPDSAGQPTALGWNDSASMLYIRTTRGLWQTGARPGATTVTRVAATDTARADTMLAVWLGAPRFARAIPCPGGGVCIIGPRGDTAAVAPDGHDPVRWGGDSVAWIDHGAFKVRSLGPGVGRKVTWSRGPDNPRQPTFARGVPATTP
jgi:hypothetical protein